MVPHSLHFLKFSSAIHALMYGLSWYPKLSTWKTSSRMIVGSVCAGFRQYQRRRSENRGQCGTKSGRGETRTSRTIRTSPFDHDTDRVRESDGVVWGVG